MQEKRNENLNETDTSASATIVERAETDSQSNHSGSDVEDRGASCSYQTPVSRSRSTNRQRLVAHSTAMESIQAESDPIDEVENLP